MRQVSHIEYSHPGSMGQTPRGSMRSVSWLSCYGGYRAGAGNPLGQGDFGGRRTGHELEGAQGLLTSVGACQDSVSSKHRCVGLSTCPGLSRCFSWPYTMGNGRIQHLIAGPYEAHKTSQDMVTLSYSPRLGQQEGPPGTRVRMALPATQPG